MTHHVVPSIFFFFFFFSRRVFNQVPGRIGNEFPKVIAWAIVDCNV